MALTPQQIRDAADTKLAQLWTAIQNKQTAYAAAHNGRYWQGLRSHQAIPADGATAIPDIGTATPTDQPDPWPSVLRTATMPMALQLDVYDGPAGTGYVATVSVTIAGQTWTRTAQVGPEGWRAAGWAVVSGTP